MTLLVGAHVEVLLDRALSYMMSHGTHHVLEISLGTSRGVIRKRNRYVHVMLHRPKSRSRMFRTSLSIGGKWGNGRVKTRVPPRLLWLLQISASMTVRPFCLAFKMAASNEVLG